MAIRIGNIEPVDFHLGDKPVEMLCLGNKVVWQRRLVEGRDYERYQWLLKTEQGIIQITLKGNVELVAASEDVDSVQTNIITDPLMAFAFYRYQNIPYLYLFKNGSSQIGGGRRYYSGNQAKILISSEYAEYDGNRYWTTQNGYFYINRENGVFYRLFNDTSLNLKIKYVKSDDALLMPIKLLRDIPAFMASDNKPHPAGECGMLDEVSGKFYGNANASGSFTVSND